MRLGRPSPVLRGRAWSRGSSSGCGTRSRPWRPRARRSSRWTCHTPTTALPPTTSWRPPRRRRTSPATTASASGIRSATGTCSADYLATRGTGFGAEVQAAHHARHLRAVRGLPRRLLRQGAQGAHAHQGRLRPRVRDGRRAGRAHQSDGGLPPRRPTRRPGRDVPVGCLHAARERRGPRRDCPCPAGCPRGCRSGSSSSAARSTSRRCSGSAVPTRPSRRRRLASDRADRPGSARRPRDGSPRA